MPNPKPTRRNRVRKKCTRRRPAGVIGSDGSDHQRVAGGSIRVIDLRTRRENGEKNINLAKKPRFQWYFPEIQWDFTRSGQILAKISLDFARLGQNLTRSKGKIIGIWVSSPDSGKLSSESRNFGRSLEIFRSVQVFRVLGEENRNWSARIGFWWWRPVANPPEQSGWPDSSRIRSVLRMDRVTGSIWTALVVIANLN